MNFRWQRVLAVLVLVFMGWLIVWGVAYLMRPATLPFHRVEILTALSYTTPRHLKQITWSNLKGGFFSLDVKQIKQALLDDPWVANISLRRKWPDILMLSIEEQHPDARWGRRGVVNQEGQIFYPPVFSIPKDLPIINGVKANKEVVLADFREMNETLKFIDLHIQCLNLKSSMTYEVLLSNGIVVVVNQGQVAHRFDRFVNLYPKIIGERGSEVERVDLRYTNGLAVKWRAPKQNLNAKSVASNGNRRVHIES